MTALRDALLDFIGDLRAAGVRISVAESLDAMRAVAAAGLARSRMREALATALIKEEADRAIFDEIFGRRFTGRSPGAGQPHRSKGDHVGLHGMSGGPGDSAMQSAPRDRRDDEPPAGFAPARKPSPAQRDRPQQPSAKITAPERQPDDGEGHDREGPADASGSESAAHPTDSDEHESGGGREASDAEADSLGQKRRGRAGSGMTEKDLAEMNR
jgi:uncharacterized protein with von Willebrand factor type A (vWA) domain